MNNETEAVGVKIVTSQAEAIEKFKPYIEKGRVFEKYKKVKARKATVGEKIVTKTADGIETKNTAKEGDYVVKNLTQAQEQYIIPETTLRKRYVAEFVETPGWNVYKPKGECKGSIYNGEDTVFIAAWGEEMVLKKGDMIVTLWPDANEVYRIAISEFNQTYRSKEKWFLI